jgi:uncharacterized protein YbcI
VRDHDFSSSGRDGDPASLAVSGHVLVVDGAQLTQISNAVVRLYKQVLGRGPTQVRTTVAGGDAILITLEQSLTVAERLLASRGEDEHLRGHRARLRHAVAHDLKQTVEQITGRTVRAWVGDMDVAADLAAEVFYLEPLGRAPSPSSSNAHLGHTTEC